MIIRFRNSLKTDWKFVLELFENESDCLLLDGEMTSSLPQDIEKFKQLINDATEAFSGYWVGKDYAASRRLSDDGISIYTNNSSLI